MRSPGTPLGARRRSWSSSRRHTRPTRGRAMRSTPWCLPPGPHTAAGVAARAAMCATSAAYLHPLADAHQVKHVLGAAAHAARAAELVGGWRSGRRCRSPRAGPPASDTGRRRRAQPLPPRRHPVEAESGSCSAIWTGPSAAEADGLVAPGQGIHDHRLSGPIAGRRSPGIAGRRRGPVVRRLSPGRIPGPRRARRTWRRTPSRWRGVARHGPADRWRSGG